MVVGDTVTVGKVSYGEARLEVVESRSKPGRVTDVVGARRALPVDKG